MILGALGENPTSDNNCELSSFSVRSKVIVWMSVNNRARVSAMHQKHLINFLKLRLAKMVYLSVIVCIKHSTSLRICATALLLSVFPTSCKPKGS